MKRTLLIGASFTALFIAFSTASLVFEKKSQVQAASDTVESPRFEVDPMWPKPLPNHWVIGNAIGVSVDSNDHIWIIHRGASLERMETYAAADPVAAECCLPAPPVLEFDPEGNLVSYWGGPGEGFDWPASNHGITVDYKGNVWIGGNGREAPRVAAGGGGAKAKPIADPRAAYALAGSDAFYNDAMILKFSKQGKFLMQIGKPGQSEGSNDTANLKGPAKLFIDPRANEVYVADGYVNKRVIVFDSETGAYKRHWGAYGAKPDDTNLGPYKPTDPPAKQFRTPVHCAELSNDQLLYVCDRVNNRIQVFKPDGSFVKEAILYKNTLGDGAIWDIAFSKDPQQKYIFLADGANEKVRVLDRQTLTVLTSFGDGGRQPGQFYAVHSIATDSKGNVYTTETYRGQRLQKFVYKGIDRVQREQGVVWPRVK